MFVLSLGASAAMVDVFLRMLFLGSRDLNKDDGVALALARDGRSGDRRTTRCPSLCSSWSDWSLDASIETW